MRDPLGRRVRSAGRIRPLPTRHPAERVCVFIRLPSIDCYTWRVDDPATGTRGCLTLDVGAYQAIMAALDARPWCERRAGGGYLYRLAVETIGRAPTNAMD
jgi:hypothetical protein